MRNGWHRQSRNDDLVRQLRSEETMPVKRCTYSIHIRYQASSNNAAPSISFASPDTHAEGSTQSGAKVSPSLLSRCFIRTAACASSLRTVTPRACADESRSAAIWDADDKDYRDRPWSGLLQSQNPCRTYSSTHTVKQRIACMSIHTSVCIQNIQVYVER